MFEIRIICSNFTMKYTNQLYCILIYYLLIYYWFWFWAKHLNLNTIGLCFEWNSSKILIFNIIERAFISILNNKLKLNDLYNSNETGIICQIIKWYLRLFQIIRFLYTIHLNDGLYCWNINASLGMPK